MSKSLKLAFNAAPTPDHVPELVVDGVCEYVTLALRVDQAERVASAIRYAGPKVHKFLSSVPATMLYSPTAERMRESLQYALAQLDDPLGWVSSQILPDVGTRSPPSVYHVAVVVLMSLIAHTRNIVEAFTYWKAVTKQLGSTFIPTHATSLLAYKLGRAGHFTAAHEVLTAMRESVAELPHTALSRELWIYAEQGKVEDAVRVWGDVNMRHSPTRFDNLCLATAYATSGDVKRTKDTITSLLGSTALSRTDSLAVLQRACIAAGDVDEAVKFLDLSVAIRPSLSPFQALLRLYAKNADVAAAAGLFSRMMSMGVTPNAKSYTTLISAFANIAHYPGAQHVFDAMVAAGHKPDAVAYSAVINAAIEAGQWQTAADLAEKVPADLLTDASLVTTILKALVLVSAPTAAVVRLFRSLVFPSARAWALVMQSAVDHRNIRFARSLFSEMDSTSKLDVFAARPNVYVFSILLAGYLRRRDNESGRAVYDEMLSRKILPTNITYGIVISSFTRAPGENSFEQAHNFAMSVSEDAGEVEGNLTQGETSAHVFGPLLVAAGRSGDIARAKEYYDMIKDAGGASIVIDTKLMTAYRQAGKFKSVYRLWLRIFRRAERTIPRMDKRLPAEQNMVTRAQNNIICVPMSIMIQTLADAGMHDRLKELWVKVRKSGFGRDSQNYNHYASALARTGDIEGAFRIAERVLIPRYDEVRERYLRALRTPLGLQKVEADIPDNVYDSEDYADAWVSEQPEDMDGEEGDPASSSHPGHPGLPLTNDDVADPRRLRYGYKAFAPPEYKRNSTISSTEAGLSILRNWRPSDVLWRPSRATIIMLELTYRQLEDQNAHRAWIGLGVGEDEQVDDEPPPIVLAEFNTTVKNQDGTDRRITPKVLITRLQRKYGRIVGLLMLHRRKRAAREERKRRVRLRR